MSSSDVSGSEDFEDLIAAVDSLEIPIDDESPLSQNAASINAIDNVANASGPKETNPFLAAAYKAKEEKANSGQTAFAAVQSLAKAQQSQQNSSAEVLPFESELSLEEPEPSDEAALLDEAADAQVESFNPYEDFLSENSLNDNNIGENNINDSSDAAEEELLDGFDGAAAASEVVNLFHEDEQIIENSPAQDKITLENSEPEETVESTTVATFPVRELGQTAQESTAIEKAIDEQMVEEVADEVAHQEESITLSKEDQTPMAAFLANSLGNDKTSFFSLYGFSQRFPRAYLVMTTLFALVGFIYILMLPVLFGIATINGFEMLNSPLTDNITLMLGMFFCMSMFLFMATYKLFDLKFVEPEGIPLDEENAEQLMEKLASLKKEHRMPRIHQVVLTRRHELNVIKIPRFGFGIPVWSKNVLAIGYPFMQTLPEEYFNAALSRRLIQFTKRRNMLMNWLSFMRRTWTLYATSLKDRNGVIDLLHYCFFAPYASMYRSFAVYVSQRDELKADEMALSVCNDRDLLKTAQTIRITQSMLVQYFWPRLNEALQDNLSSPKHVRPYYNLPGTLESLLSNENVQSWFIRLAQENSAEGTPEPAFRQRMEHMGFSKISIPGAFDTSAAEHYFGEDYDEMTDDLDSLWADEVQQALFIENLDKGEKVTELPFNLAIEPA